jgi:hypothetical protein
MPRDVGPRVEVRRPMSWFNDKIVAEVSGALVMERVYKRFIPAGDGGGPPDTETTAKCLRQRRRDEFRRLIMQRCQ